MGVMLLFGGKYGEPCYIALHTVTVTQTHTQSFESPTFFRVGPESGFVFAPASKGFKINDPAKPAAKEMSHTQTLI